MTCFTEIHMITLKSLMKFMTCRIISHEIHCSEELIGVIDVEFGVENFEEEMMILELIIDFNLNTRSSFVVISKMQSE